MEINMSWLFHEVGNLLVDNGISTRSSNNTPENIKVLLSDYVSISDDVFDVNAVTYYVYGCDSGEALLLELSLSKCNQEYEKQYIKRYKDLVSELFFKSTGHYFPQEEDFLHDDHQVRVGDFFLVVSDKPETEPKTVRVFISTHNKLEQGLELRNKHLYPALYA